MTNCRLGLIGAGNVGQRHARVLAGFDDVDLVAVADTVSPAAQRLADQYGARTYPDADALVTADLDAVYICVPPFAHGPVEEAVLAAGLPMFVEKPVAADLETAVRIGDLVAERDALTAVGHHWRYLTVVERAQELLAGRTVRMVSGSWLDRVPPATWWARREQSGGPVVEQAAHVLDLTRMLAGEVGQIVAYGDGRAPAADGADIDGATAAVIRFTSGAVGTLTSACVLGWRHRAGLEILADGLALRVSEDGLVIHEAGKEYRFPADPDAARVAVDRAFIDAVCGIADDVRVPYGQAVKTHRLACAVAESAATGHAVWLAEIAAAPIGGENPAGDPAGGGMTRGQRTRTTLSHG